MIFRSKATECWVMVCDGKRCETEITSKPNVPFRELIILGRKTGWHAEQANGKWWHTCPDCTAKKERRYDR